MTLMSFDESYKLPIVLHVTELIKKGVVKKTYKEFAFDL
jgi:hypothetical protein